MLLYNIGNYLIKRESERHIIMKYILNKLCIKYKMRSYLFLILQVSKAKNMCLHLLLMNIMNTFSTVLRHCFINIEPVTKMLNTLKFSLNNGTEIS